MSSSSSLVALEVWCLGGAACSVACCRGAAGSTTVSCTVTVTVLVPGRGRLPEEGTGDVDDLVECLVDHVVVGNCQILDVYVKISVM